jgi:nicotinamide-nucleotide amidase
MMLTDAEITALATRVVAENQAAGRMVATAESCTGGLVTAAITDIPGSSAVLQAGFVTYADEAKRALLGVSRDIIETFGAVSAACAWAMAKGAVEKSGADVAVAITGIAGPGGGSEKKPVGTVVFARALKGEGKDCSNTVIRHFDPALGRDGIRRQAVAFALELLLPEA